jgi:NAD(P)-dependent dehydrogenase (short-subunit alcohol dehydrogenase family)
VTYSLDFAEKTVIVTGGGKGVGRGVTEAFLRAGADVIICGRRAPEVLPESGSRSARFVAADVREAEQIDAVIDAALEVRGRLDVLVNNAGGAPFVMAAEAKPSLHEKIIALNLTAPLHFSQKANAVMQAQESGGVIVNVASVSGTRPSPGTAAYGAAKAGLLNLTRSLAVEWAPKVRINCVTAGMIRTEQAHLHYGGEEGIASVSATVPLGRMGLPEDVAHLCLFLASPLSSYVSGASLVMDGGGERPAFLDAATANKD